MSINKENKSADAPTEKLSEENMTDNDLAIVEEAASTRREFVIMTEESFKQRTRRESLNDPTSSIRSVMSDIAATINDRNGNHKLYTALERKLDNEARLCGWKKVEYDAEMDTEGLAFLLDYMLAALKVADIYWSFGTLPPAAPNPNPASANLLRDEASPLLLRDDYGEIRGMILPNGYGTVYTSDDIGKLLIHAFSMCDFASCIEYDLLDGALITTERVSSLNFSHRGGNTVLVERTPDGLKAYRSVEEAENSRAR